MLVTLAYWALLIVPWLSFFLLSKESRKRFLPVALFAAIVVTLVSEYAYTHQWWVFQYKLFPSFITNIPLVYGAFLVGTMWIFHFTYGHFLRYMLVNIVLDTFTMYPLNAIMVNLGMYQLVNITRWQVVAMSLVQAVGLYLFQIWIDSAFKSQFRNPGGGGESEQQARPPLLMPRKEKAR